MAEISIGKKAPDFKLASSTGKTLSLKDFKGQVVVLYFYPRDMTPGCTTEACDFRDRHSELEKLGAVVIGISTDDLKKHAKFIEKYELTFPLLADTDKEVHQLYGVWKEKNMYGKKVMGTERSTFIIGKDGKITHIFPKVKVTGHVEEVLAAVKEII